jgi:bifunctional DNA-binding transcriptional regulator/antitoxin component of YhaV-PrlF toxin-antitoxin module
MPGTHKFKTKLLGMEGSEVAAFKPPFDVLSTFGAKGRVAVKGTINGHPFRSSLMNMGDGHMMVVNKELRQGAKCKAGDTVEIVLERDHEKRTVEVPPFLKKLINAEPKAKAFWDKLSFTHQKEYVREITEAKREETRHKRIEQMMSALRRGERKK